MSKEVVTEFLTKIETDKDLGARAAEAKDHEALLAVARENGYEMTLADLQAGLHESDRALSDAELDNVAGARKRPGRAK